MGKEHDLIQPGVTRRRGVWAAVTAGTVAYTVALLGLIGPAAELYVVERDAGALNAQRRALAAKYPNSAIHYLEADFTQPAALALPPLDGLLLANVLHSVPFDRQESVLAGLAERLASGSRLILIEYERQQGMPWSRYPVTYEAFENLAAAAGMRDVRRLAALPASFFRDVYSAAAERP